MAALRRQLGAAASSTAVARAADIAMQIATAAPAEGRALFAATRALAEPRDPLARLWHAATLLREHRGDGHVGALLAAGVDGREAHVLHALATGTPREVYAESRRLGVDEWAEIGGRLRGRGLLDASGKLTAAGRELKQDIEDRTDALAWSAYARVAHRDLEELVEVLRPITAAVVAAGEMPTPSPIGIDLTAAAGAGPR